ncbi:MAG: PBECR3 domain-containing polyvalent protein [Halothiobacillus sp.]
MLPVGSTWKKPVPDVQPSVISGVFKRPFAEQSGFFRQKLANLIPTAKWDDIQKSAHDKGFMVAGAVKADLLASLATAVDRAVTEGKSIQAFRQDFRSIVEQQGWHGWTGEGTAKGEAWRTKIIYTTNAKTSYAAGRYAQLQDGGFDLWIYRHSDAVAHPRPQHLAWNGLTLPANHAFWSTHYPPNGWGCDCYVTGARSSRGAQRLGGDPNKALPAGWNATSPKTGEPDGIDKGWGYAPGATVSDTVQAMAQKTTQWQYTLAKSYMQSMPEDVRDLLATAYRALPSVADDTRRYAQAVLAGKAVDPYRTMGLLTKKDVAAIDQFPEVGKKVDSYDFALDQFGVKHVHSHHGDVGTEAPRGQRPVIASDYALLPSVLTAPDSIRYGGMTDIGRPVVIYAKKINGETLTAAFELRNKRKMLALQSFWVVV